MKYIISLFIMLGTYLGYAQQDLTLYNMRYLQQASFTNPAFFSECKVNVGFIFSSFHIRGGNSGFVWKDLVGIQQDSLYFSPVNALDKMKGLNYIEQEFRTDPIHFGFRLKEKNYISFNMSVRETFRLSYPKDLFTLMFFGNGMTEAEATAQGYDPNYALLGKRANLDGAGIDMMLFSEIGVQYARKFLTDNKLSIGIRPKLLLGGANVYTRTSTFGLHTDPTTYALTADGDMEINTSIPYNENDSNFDISAASVFRNLGFGADLGATYDINEKFQVSGSVTDLGYIKWKNSPRTYTINDKSLAFNGIIGIEDALLSDDADDSTSTEIENLADSLADIFIPVESNKPYTTWLTTRVNLGGNYQFAEKHNLGLLLNGHLVKRKLRAAMTLSYNFRVRKWFGFSANYSIYNRSFKNVGLGMSFNVWPIQFYVMTDNVLAAIPHTAKNAHVRFGANLTFGCKVNDKDKDGIPDKDDDCPRDPGPVELKGCPDTDGDGLIDKNDSCITEKGPVELLGCPDRDGDGVIDKKDECPDTAGLEMFNGCPDLDGDGLIDQIDSCPSEPGIPFFQGCPDTDNDSIQDSKDDCPQLPGPIEFNGCPDTDEDGLTDNVDACPNEAGPLDNNGCPLGDRDGDGVLDKNDSCPDTPGPAENDGCPYADLDRDGVLDKDDRCPKTPGPESNQGCPVIEEDEQDVINTAFANLEFESGKDVITQGSLPSLDRLAELLKSKEGWRLQISGHTDNVGDNAANMRLSELRAKAVSNYLQSKGVERRKLIVQWFGESRPVASNQTPEGRKANRRVEMEIVFN